MNKVILIGRLTKDPEIKTTQSGKECAQFTIAVDRRFKNKDGQKETDFLPVVVWGNVAGLIEMYSGKGKRICVVGSVQTRSYDANDGTKRYVTEIVANEVEFIDFAGDETKKAHGEPAPIPEGFTEAEDEKLPF